MRVIPRLNDDVNEEWINDKTRFACDGLKTQRLTIPLVRREGKFEPASWEQALTEIGHAFQTLAPKGNEFKAIAGPLTEVESLVAMKDLANKLGSENLALDQPAGSQPIAHGIDVRSNYLFNSKIWGIESTDCILLVGTNPRHEAAVMNARIRKQWLRSDLEVGLVGETFDSTFEFEHLGTDLASLKTALAGEDNDEAVKVAFDKLNESQGKLGEAIYASSQADAAAESEAPTDAPQNDASDEDVVDAEVVEDDEPKKDK
jgi:NADH dehydrogenase (ubiquinone) Fe-S protein 1